MEVYEIWAANDTGNKYAVKVNLMRGDPLAAWLLDNSLPVPTIEELENLPTSPEFNKESGMFMILDSIKKGQNRE